MQGDIDPQMQLALAELGYISGCLAAVGETGAVYRCHHVASNSPVAVKILDQGPPSFELLTDIHHPSHIPLLAVHRSGPRGILVSPWCEAVSLAATLRSSGPLTVQDAIKLIRSVAELLLLLHQEGRTHGSLKPADVLIADGQPIRVLDAAWPRSHAAGDRNRALAGMAGPQSDLHQLGGVAYAALTGRSCGNDETGGDTLVDVAALMPNLPQDVSEICRRCLAPKISDGYTSASEVLADLDRIERGEPVLRRQPGALGNAATHFGDSPAPVLTLIIIAILLLLAWPERQIGWDKVAAAGALTGMLIGAFVEPRFKAAPAFSGACIAFFLGEWAWIQLPKPTGAIRSPLAGSTPLALETINRWLVSPWVWMLGAVTLGIFAGVGWTSLQYRDQRWRTTARWWFIGAVATYLLLRLGSWTLVEIDSLRTTFAIAKPVAAFLAYAAIVLPAGSLLARGVGAVSGGNQRAPGHIQTVIALGVLATALVWCTFPVALTPSSNSIFLYRTLSLRQLTDQTNGWLMMPMGSGNFATLLLLIFSGVASLFLAIGLRAPRVGMSLLASSLSLVVAYLILTHIDRDLLWAFRLLPMLIAVATAGALVLRYVRRGVESMPYTQPTSAYGVGWKFIGMVFLSIILYALLLPPLRALSG